MPIGFFLIYKELSKIDKSKICFFDNLFFYYIGFHYKDNDISMNRVKDFEILIVHDEKIGESYISIFIFGIFLCF